MKLIAAALLAVQAPSATASTEQGSATLSQKMAPFSPLVGTWRGSGWMLLPDGTRQAFESRETVTARISGHALLVEGRHYAPGNPGQPVHDALALITWDQRANSYRFRSALANGTGGDFPLEVEPGRFVWRMEAPGGRIEYMAEFSAERWVERGRRIATNGQSTDFFEMTLRRD